MSSAVININGSVINIIIDWFINTNNTNINTVTSMSRLLPPVNKPFEYANIKGIGSFNGLSVISHCLGHYYFSILLNINNINNTLILGHAYHWLPRHFSHWLITTITDTSSSIPHYFVFININIIINIAILHVISRRHHQCQ